MLRSSREGRKQAARYHTFQDKQNSDSISISYFYSNNNDGKANGSNQHKNKNDHIDLRQNSDYKDEERHNNETFISTRSTYSKPKKGVDENQKRIFSLNNKRKDDGSKRIENQVESRIKNKMNAISNWSDSLTISSTTSSSLGNQDVPIDTTPWSRETSLDSHSNGDAATSLSSPPSSRATFDLNSTNQINEIEIQIRHPSTDKDDNDEEMYAEGESIQTPTKSSSKRTGWEEEVSDNTSYLVQPYSIDDDSSLSSLSDDSMEEEEDDDDQNSISSPRRISISPSPSTHTNQEDSIISQRPRRRISKTLKQVEAEESLALTPKRLGRLSIPSSGSSSKSMRAEKADEGKNKIAETTSINVDRIPLRSRRSDVLNKEKEDMMNDLSSNLSSDDGQSPIRKMGRPRGTTKEFLLQRAVTNRISLSPSRQQLSSSKSVSNSLNDNVDDKVKRRIPTSASHSALDNLRKTIIQTESGSTSSTSIEHITTTTVQREQKENRPSWKRKVFLTSGLYSNDHKTNDGAKIPTKKSLLDSNNPLLQGTSRIRNSNRVSAFPLPTDFGHWVLTEKRDFRLPFPISQEIDEIRQKMALKRQPPPYKHISTNRYVSRPKLPGEIMICQCPPTGTCDENCVNRQTQYLCHPKHCPCGERCTNIQFGKRKSIKTEVHWYGARGFGLRTKEPIAKGAFIDEYRGEVVDYNEMVRRVRDHYKDTGNYYFLMYDAPAGEMLDGGLRGNITRFANHSCDPNCGIQKWLVCGTDEQRAGEFQVALFASRDIAAGEELTYDYGWSAFSPKSVTGEPGEACHCGATNCSGIMGVRKSATINKISNTTGTSQSIQKKSKKNKRKRKVHSKTSKLIKQNDQLNVMQNLSNNVEEATQRNDTKYRKINLPQPLLSIIPAGYLDGNEIRVSTSILNKVKDDLKADVSNPLGRKRWEHAVALIIESHIQHAKEVVNKAATPLPPIVDLKRPASENVEMVKEEEVMKTKRIKIVRSTITTVSAPVPTSESEIVINSTSDTEMTSSKDLIDSPTKKSSTPLKKKEKSKAKADVTSSEKAKEKEKEREKSEEKKAVRTYVRDRVAMELVGAPANLIDDDFIPIMEGKRQRKVSQKFNETQEEALKRINLEKEKKESSSSSSSKPINLKSPKIGDQSWITIGDQSESLSSDIGNLSTTNIGDLSSLLPSDFQFDLSSYPEGTKFYLRTGEPYDFNVLNLTRRGKKPRPYTLEEIAEADERHRVNLKRLNDLRKFK